MNSQRKPKERRERKERRSLPSVLSAAPAAALTAAVVCLAAAACSGGSADLASVEVNTSPEDTRDEGAQAASPQSPQPASPPSPSSADTSSASGGASQVRTTSSNPDPLPERPRTSPQASVTRLPSPSSGGGRAAAPQKIYLPVAVEWEALRQCESRGSYTFVDPTGTYHGAYQFTTRTWDRLAAGFDDNLLGVLPSEASAADQDKMAARLWIESRSSRWPACAHVFGREAAEEYLASLQRSSQTPSEAAPATSTTASTTTAAAPATSTTSTAAAPAPSSGASEDPSPTSTTAAAASEAGSSSPASPPSDPGGGADSGDGDGADDTGGAGGGDDAPSAPAGGAETAPDPSTLPAVIPNVAGFPTQEQWAALRHCESRNNYQIESSNGLYYGAYQFWPDTWNGVARKYYPRLLNVLPSHATPQDQDRMAYKLWETRGSQPWPVCGRHLN